MRITARPDEVSGDTVIFLIYLNKSDMLSGYFDERVTLHFSLHLIEDRARIMPINNKYPYQDVLNAMNDIVDITGEKPCIGILLFKDYTPIESNYVYSNDLEKIDDILGIINPLKFRISFCEFNNSDDIGHSSSYNEIETNAILTYALSQGFEAKLFSSFGKKEQSACGMLGSKRPDFMPSKKWIQLDEEADRLISVAMEKICNKNIP